MATIAFCKVTVTVPDAIVVPTKFKVVPSVNIAVGMPDSFASGHPSPSESKS